jgi:predicted secreted protein
MRFATALALVASGALGIAQAANSAVRYNPRASEPQVIHVGDNFVVPVESMPGAGYSWDIWKNGREGLSLIALSSRPKDKGRLGGSQIDTYTFRATATGRPTITMTYGRPWEMEKGIAPAKTLVIPVIIK